MTHHRQHDRDRDRDRATPSVTDDAAPPGRASASAMLRRPEAPVPSGIVMRKAAGAEAASGSTDALAAASSGAGRELPGELRERFEHSLGTDLSAVRVHTGGDSQAAARSVSAHAYAVGNDIHFGAGQYDPASASGRHLIAHEVAHTVQQRGGSPAPQHKLAISAPSDAFELEADRAADAMLAGAPASVSSGGVMVSRKYGDQQTQVVDPETYHNDPEQQAHENVEVDDRHVRWDEKTHFVDGERVERKSGLNMYGPDARAHGIQPDPADPYGVADVSGHDWSSLELAGPDVPGRWHCSFSPKQPLPVIGPDPMKQGEMTPIPVQESQIAFAQACVNAFQAPYAQAQSSWETMSTFVEEFNTAGNNPMFHEGGLNWLPSKDPSKQERSQNMEQLAGKQKVGTGKTTVDDVKKMTDEGAKKLESDLPQDKKDALEKAAGKPAASLTAADTAFKTVKTELKKQELNKQALATANKSVSLDKLEQAQGEEKDKLAAAQAKQKQLDTAVKHAFTVIDIGIAFAGSPEAMGKLTYSVMKAVMTQAASTTYERDMKAASAKIKELGGQMQELSTEIAVEGVITAAGQIEAQAETIMQAKSKLVTALKTAEDDHEEFAKIVAAQVGGKKGDEVRAAIEALPKVALVAKTCESVVSAAVVPGFSERAGYGMLGAADPPANFVQHCGEMNGYRTTFSARAKEWSAALARLEAIAKSYGLGN